MKRVLTYLSAVFLAANAFAADKLEAGTADAPNYYVLKAGRGTPYLAYSDEYLSTPGGADTRLHRTDALTEANIWAVTPGEAQGTLKIQAYGSSRGLMTFIAANGDGVSCATGAIATVAKAQDIYPKYQDNGTVSLSVNNFEGYESDGDGWFYYTLDATNNSEFLGNWIPGDTGTNWTAFKLDLTNGVDAALAGVQQAALQAERDAKVALYEGVFTNYANGVPWVADILGEGIAALKEVKPTPGYSAEIDSIWALYTGNAANALNTMFVGKDIALKNLRRANVGRTPYVSAGTGAYTMVANYATTPAAVFTMEAAEVGYYIYNAATQTYFNVTAEGAITTVAEKENATEVKFVLQTGGGFYGVDVLVPTLEGMNALNADQRIETNLVRWSANDAGSIWAIEAADFEGRVESIIENTIKPYMEAVPSMVKILLQAAIDEIKALSAGEDQVIRAQEIADKAIADANALLATGLNGIKFSLKNLRQNKFISIAGGEWVYDTENVAAETAFTFMAQEDGGYVIYNEAANVFFGEVETEESDQTNVTVATEESAAIVVYPFLCKGGNFTGVALALEAGPIGATYAINTNANAKILHAYRADDAGSIFALVDVKDYEPEVKAMIAQYTGYFQAYIDAVPWVAAELQEGIEALGNVAITAEYADAITTIWNEYIDKANAALNIMFADKHIALKNLRRANVGMPPYLSVSAEAYPMTADYYSNIAAVFTMEAATDGYYLYNAATQSYFGLTEYGAITTVYNKRAACNVKFALNNKSDYTGVNLLVPGREGMNAFNADQHAETNLVFYTADDAGSTWAIVASNIVGTKIGGLHYIFDPTTQTASVTYAEQNRWENYEGLQSVIVPETVEFKGESFTVTAIGDEAFNNCWGLKAIVLPSTLQTVGKLAFGYCISLRSITIPDEVTLIDNEAFTGCSALASVEIGTSVETIGDFAFFGCTGLSELKVPESVKTIGENAFMGIHWINEVQVKAAEPADAPTSAFSNNAYRNATLVVPDGAVDIYKAHPTWSNFKEIRQASDDHTQIEVVDGALIVKGTEEVRVFNAAGSQVYCGPAGRISLPAGIYVVATDSLTKKVHI